MRCEKTKDMKFRPLLLLLIVGLLGSCASTTQVINLKNTLKHYPNASIYSLPKTRLEINFSVQKNTFVPGPYSKYAKKYLGIADVQFDITEQWQIAGIQIETSQIPDTAHFYAIVSNKNYAEKLSTLESNGLIIDFAKIKNERTTETTQKIRNAKSYEELFPDLSMKKNFKEKRETIYETKMVDSVMVRIPKTVISTIMRSEEDKAIELVNTLIRLRKRRFKLVAGIEKNTQNNQSRQYAKEYPEGNTMKKMLEELQNIEDEILYRFTGKQVQQNFTHNLTWIPDAKNISNRKVIAYYSDISGLQKKQEYNTIPVSVEVIAKNYTSIIDKYNAQKKLDSKINGLAYRVADVAKVRILLGNKVIAEKEVAISQLGTVVSMPIK